MYGCVLFFVLFLTFIRRSQRECCKFAAEFAKVVLKISPIRWSKFGCQMKHTKIGAAYKLIEIAA